MGRTVPVSQRPDPDAPGTGGRNRAERVVTCAVIDHRTGDRCTAEALDPDAEVRICVRHAALVLELVRKETDAR